MPEQPQYPVVAINPSPQGIVVSIARSPIETQTLLIPVPDADQIAIRWLATRPQDVLNALKAEVRRARQEIEDIQHAIANPLLVPMAKGRH